MHENRKFDPKGIAKLNNPERLVRENPDVIWRELDLREPRVLIDIGAGTGFFAVPFARKSPAIMVYACDLQEEMLAWMAEHLPADLHHRIKPFKMEESVVPLPDSIADLVYMINLHHELEDRDAMMGEAFRLLKPGGTVLVMDWKKEETPAGPPIGIRLTAEEIVADVEKSGFAEVKLHAALAYHNMVTGRKKGLKLRG